MCAALERSARSVSIQQIFTVQDLKVEYELRIWGLDKDVS